MLSDVDEFARARFRGRSRNNNPSLYEGIDAACQFYENLITTGKLRVVEEAEWDMSIPRDPCCPFCNYGWEGLGDVHFDRDFKFYPCCGNKIIKPTQQP